MNIIRSTWAGNRTGYALRGKELDVANAIRDALRDCEDDASRRVVAHVAEYVAAALYGRPEDYAEFADIRREAPDRFFEAIGL